MSSITVTDKETGQDLVVAEADFDPEFHQLKEGQHVVVDPGAISGAEGEAGTAGATATRQRDDR